MRSRLLFLFLSLTALSAGAAPLAPSPAELGKLWLASVQAEKALDYPGALKQVNGFVQNGGDPFMAALRTGWLLYISADYHKAEASYAKALQLQPGSVNALLGALNAVRAQLDPAKTERAAKALLQVEASNYNALMTVAGIHYAAADYRKAASAYRRALVHYPDDFDALSGSGWSSLNAGDKAAAVLDFTRLLSISPEYPQAQNGFQKAGGR